MQKEERPWGSYTVLSEEAGFKVKKISIHPKKRLSLQRHQHRSEHWHLIQGEALVTLDKQRLGLRKGDSIDIPKQAAHRIENLGETELVLIEVQQGSYFGEDDIERIEDDYGRIPLNQK